MIIKTADGTELDKIAAIEDLCFPKEEAATKEIFAKRLAHYKNHFWLLYDNDRMISFADGFVTDIPDLTDEMYEKAEMHDENGKWQMIFGLNTLPEYRNKGYAGELVKRIICDAKRQKRKGVVLTCKEHLINYYAKFGFVSEGVSQSVHGGAVWYQMRITFKGTK